MWQEISYPIRPNLATYPGDTPFSSTTQNFAQNQITLSDINCGLHYGTHTDAPNHFIKNGITIEKVPLSHYMGKCQVIKIDCIKSESLIITPQQLPSLVAPRILFATNTFDYYQPYHNGYATLAPELVELLIEQKCCLIGVDTPSVDKENACNFINHRKILEAGIAIIEGLDLRNIAAGIYEMLAIPLALEGLEASPLRVLVKKSNF